MKARPSTVPCRMSRPHTGRMQLRDATADLLTTVGRVDTSHGGTDGSDHRRARAAAALAARLRLP